MRSNISPRTSISHRPLAAVALIIAAGALQGCLFAAGAAAGAGAGYVAAEEHEAHDDDHHD